MEWISGKYFAPYSDGLEYDGGADYQSFYNSVSPSGDLDWWINAIRQIWEGDSIPAKIAIAASFASPIVSNTKSLPFFTHFWGIQSGTGKTVALCVAASVWASVGTGEYVHSFNGTLVSMERAKKHKAALTALYKTATDTYATYVAAEKSYNTNIAKAGHLRAEMVKAPDERTALLKALQIISAMTEESEIERIVKNEFENQSQMPGTPGSGKAAPAGDTAEERHTS